MLKDFERRRTIEVTEYSLCFYYEDWGCGFGFPCDKNGFVDVEKLEPAGRKNYEWCVSNPQEFKYFAVVDKNIRRCHENASGVCTCGNRIELWDEYMGACECPHCGKWYNLFGQELNPPHTWKDGDDW